MSQLGDDSSSKIDSECPIIFHYSAQHLFGKEFTCTFAQIECSSASCRLCCLFKDIILTVVEGRLPSLFEAGSEDNKLILKEMKVSCGPGKLTFNIMNWPITLVIFKDRHTEAHRDFKVQGIKFLSGARIGRRTNSKESFTRAKKWLLDCLTSHPCPRPSSGAVPLPKRLLDVGVSAHGTIQLIETQGHEHPYVCLSHRWGSSAHRQLKTTLRTIQDHMIEITWHDLPATFQDAVTICRSMGVRYLWIDSLCILQNFDGITLDELKATGQDFGQENSVMGRTYQNSHFTISADLTTHMDSGIFSKRPIDDHKIQVIADDGRPAFLYIRQLVNHHGSQIPALETRGWTFQEFLLPPRVLHFEAFDIEWRCKARLTCECEHLDRKINRQAPWHRHHYLEPTAQPAPADPEGALRWWESVVHSYTSRELTNASDKLPALSGLAQLHKQARGDVYMAGLWQESLTHDLCWYHTLDHNRPRSGGVGRRPADYRAPSWSWASVDTDSGCSFWWTGMIGIHPCDAWDTPQKTYEIFETLCEPKTADPTGEVQSGAFLDMKVALIPAEICQDPKQEVVWTINNVHTSLALQFFKPDCKLEDDRLMVGGQVYCAPIAETIVATGLQRGCLVLKKLDINVYQRVGFCILSQGNY